MSRTAPASPLFVTGTDTGVGKTHVSRALVRLLVRANVPIAPVKIIETGCTREGDRLRSHDGLALARAAGLESQLDLVAPERFELAASPEHAARSAGRRIRLGTLADHVANARSIAPRVLIEGAGGLLVPIGPDETFRELAVALDARVLVVARDALGTLNHTLLTVEAARSRGLRVVGIVLDAKGPSPPTLDHASDLRALLPDVPVYGPLAWLANGSDDDQADALLSIGLDLERALALWD